MLDLVDHRLKGISVLQILLVGVCLFGFLAWSVFSRRERQRAYYEATARKGATIRQGQTERELVETMGTTPGGDTRMDANTRILHFYAEDYGTIIVELRRGKVRSVQLGVAPPAPLF